LQVVTTALALAAAAFAQAGTTIDPAHPYAHGANIGWMNARGDLVRGMSVGQFFCAGYLWSANAGWISLGNRPTNHWHYCNTGADDWGVNHDGQGRLEGYAYGANIGWVVFEQAHGRPRVDLHTGALDGYAYGANIGWISLSNAQAFVRTSWLANGGDSEYEGIPDPWEYARVGRLDLLQRSPHDHDQDGMTDREEYLADTDPTNAADRLRITMIAVSNGVNRVAWTCRPTRLYRLTATNCPSGAGNWPDTDTGLLGPGVAGTVTQTVTGVAATSRHYRVHAIVPLSQW
jgi:hypothetical protein